MALNEKEVAKKAFSLCDLGTAPIVYNIVLRLYAGEKLKDLRTTLGSPDDAGGVKHEFINAGLGFVENHASEFGITL